MRILLGYVLTFGWVFLMLGLTLVLKRAFLNLPSFIHLFSP